MPRSPELVAEQRASLGRAGIAEAPLVDCHPWCTDGDGHPAESHPADQWCPTLTTSVALSFYPSQECVDGTFAPETATVYGSGRHHLRRDEVRVDHGDTEVLRLTLDEAKALADALLATVSLMSQGGAA
ncbi:DUF6907 domain-containing protein [Cellulomonas endometrii]|uniref:DUF6907 domain-containing protein n=1 Tax=Cellulomonas endometrii TaxID=3036301 RepID=UPI003D15AAA9